MKRKLPSTQQLATTVSQLGACILCSSFTTNCPLAAMSVTSEIVQVMCHQREPSGLGNPKLNNSSLNKMTLHIDTFSKLIDILPLVNSIILIVSEGNINQGLESAHPTF